MGDSRLPSLSIIASRMKWFAVLLITVSVVSAAKETVKASVKSGKSKFSCTFTLANDGKAVIMKDSKVVCTPNKPTKRKISNFEVSTDKATYTLSFNINPEKLTKAAMTLKEEKTVACEAGFTRVCPSGNSPGATADEWSCSCLQSRMLELDIQAGLNPLGECHGECICINEDIEAITKKQKPTFFGPKEMPSYCNN